MNLKPSVIELVVADMSASLAFYRRLGLAIPAEADTESPVDVDLGGIHLAFDTRETILSFSPDWSPPTGGHRMALAFACDAPAEVDSAFAELVEQGAERHLEPWDAFWGM